MALVLSGDGSITGNPNITLTENVSIAGTVTYEDVTNVDSIGIVTARSGINITGGSLDVQGNTTITGTLVSSNGNITSEVDLTGISSSISDTAIDVFVYDTSKDSDGGAWRKRTSDTSWYNETLGTATRGSRKEFPAVAVIVTENAQVTIYDGDDPDLPMWMVFNGASGNLLAYTSGSKSTVMLNGKLANAAGGSNQRFRTIDFISDFHVEYASTDGRTNFGINISQRNSGSGITNYGNVSGNGLIDRNCNDVVMTVLPNAPIDPSTGLPVPTIAVGTEGGPSIIKDDGNVVDVIHTAYKNITQIFFTEDNLLAYLAAGTVNQTYGFHYIKIPSGDLDNGTDGREVGTHDVRFYNGDGRNYTPSLGTKAYGHSFIDGAIGYSLAPIGGLTLLEKDAPIDYANSSIAFVNTDYNTGWMHGDCKGAFLSDTSTVSMPGSNLITNGDFSNGSTGWTLQSGWTVSSNTATCDGTNGAYISQPNTGEIPANTPITVTVTITAYTSGTIRLGSTGVAPATSYSGTGTHSATFITRSSATSGVELMSINFVGTIDNVIVTLAEEDRSVNDNPLQVFGTITKSAVATGAELVAYSGFSASNYLQQPYNSDLAPGTGAYSVSCWFKTGTSSGDQYIFDRNNGGGSNTSRNLLLIMNTSAGNANKLQWWHRDASANTTDVQITDKTVTDNAWHQVVALNDGSTYKLYVDGEVSSVTSSVIQNIGNDNNPPMFVGVRHTGGSTFMTGSMALFRYSRTAPSPEQIKKIYEDEKVLFQENAKATLYGSSDAVTALAYDEVTDQLHVGTPSGRSDFQGLRRINNTATAVTTAISAQDTFIIEQ
jgi:hypothetical protein